MDVRKWSLTQRLQLNYAIVQFMHADLHTQMNICGLCKSLQRTENLEGGRLLRDLLEGNLEDFGKVVFGPDSPSGIAIEGAAGIPVAWYAYFKAHLEYDPSNHRKPWHIPFAPTADDPNASTEEMIARFTSAVA